MIMAPLDIHATERHIEMGSFVRIEHPHKTTVVTAGSVFVLYDEVECLTFRQATDGWCGMKCMKQITQVQTI